MWRGISRAYKEALADLPDDRKKAITAVLNASYRQERYQRDRDRNHGTIAVPEFFEAQEHRWYWQPEESMMHEIEESEEEMMKCRLRDALCGLEKEQLALLTDRYGRKMSVSEIARRDGIPRTTVSSRLSRILKQLKTSFTG